MKKLLFFLLIAVLGYAVPTSAQSIPAPSFNSQMWNTSSAYYGTVTKLTVGNQLDTNKGATTKYLYQSIWKFTGNSAADSNRVNFANRLQSQGQLSFVASAWNAAALTDTPTVYITIEQSITGQTNSYVAVPGVATLTITPTSKTTASTGAINLSERYGNLYRAKATSIAGDTVSYQVNFLYTPVK